MARNWFGGDLTGWVFGRNDIVQANLLQLASGAVVTWWTAATGGTQHTDLLLNATPATSITASDGSDGREKGSLPAFQGPDGVLYMWAQVAGATARYLVLAWSIADRHTELQAQVDGLTVSAGPQVVYVTAAGVTDPADFSCDGVDDQVQIQAAVAAAVAAGAHVQLSRGDFIISAPIEIEDPVTILGTGRDTTRLVAAVGLNDYVIRFTNATGDGVVAARFAHFQVDGRCDQQTDGGGIDASGAVQCTFENLHVINAFDWGLILGPLATLGFGHHNRVVRCLFDATLTSAGHGGGVWCTSSDENWFSSSDFEFLGGETPPAGSTEPVALYDQAGLQKINDVTFVGGRENCIHVRLKDTKMTQVTSCTFDGSSGHSILATGSKHVIASNTITSPGDQGDTPASGIYLEFGATQCVVVGNSLETAIAAGKTASLIRETGDGGAGGNIIVANALHQNSAPTFGLFDLSGVASTVHSNSVGDATFIGDLVLDSAGGVERHRISAADGVARLGSKNSLTNIRFCGQKATPGAPSTGTWATGDLVLDSAGVWHLCTAGGTPGTWT